MSYVNYLKATNLLLKCDDYHSGGGKSLYTVERAEKILDVAFSKQIKDYLTTFGCVSFSEHEMDGIAKDTFDDFTTLAGNMVEMTLFFRQNHGLPKKWLPIYCFGYNGYYGYLDHSQLNADGEPPVIMAMFDGEKYIIVERVAEDFGDFLLELVENCLNNQQ